MRHVYSAFTKNAGAHSLAVKRDMLAPHAVERVNFGKLVITGVLYGVAFVAPEKLNQQIVEIFRTAADDYSPWRRVKSPCPV